MSSRSSQQVPISVKEQIRYLQDKGMTVPNRGLAERSLNHIGFQRLSAYWKPFESSDGNSSETIFLKGTSFRAALNRYLFDQRLRSHLLEAFSFIEVSVRTHWAYQLVHGFHHGEFAHQEEALFDQRYHKSNLNVLRRNCQQSGLLHNSKFQALTIWDVLRVMTFGQLSKWYSSLEDRAIRQAIAKTYGMDEAILRATLQRLTDLRNRCAHHEQLWDARIGTRLRPPRTLGGSSETPAAFNSPDRGRVYNALVMIVHLMDEITPNGDWPERLLNMKEEQNFRSIPYERMGFPENWRERTFWQRYLPGED